MLLICGLFDMFDFYDKLDIIVYAYETFGLCYFYSGFLSPPLFVNLLYYKRKEKVKLQKLKNARLFFEIW